MAFSQLRVDTGVTSEWGGQTGNYGFNVTVLYEQSIAGNYTKLRLVPKIWANGGARTNNSGWKIAFNVDAPNYYRMFSHDLSSSNPILPGEREVTIYHDVNGNASYSYYMHFWNSTTGGSGVLRAGNVGTAANKISFSLPNIPRSSSFTLSSNSMTMGSSYTINISRVTSEFTHTVRYAFGSASGTIGSSIATSVSWTPSKELARQIPNDVVGTGSIIVDTYLGSTKIGSASKTFTLYITGDMYPSFTAQLSVVDPFNNTLYLQTISRVKCDIVGAAGSYGSTIKSYSISGHALNATSASATSDILTNSGVLTYTYKITDSRGRTTTKTQSITVEPYSRPTAGISCYRSNADKVEDDEGTWLVVKANFNITNVNNNNLMAKKVSVWIKYHDVTEWSNTVNNVDLTTYSASNYSYEIPFFTSGWALDKVYDIRVRVQDSYNHVDVYYTVLQASCIIDIEKGGVGIGGYWSKGALDVVGDANVSGVLTTGDTIDCKGFINSAGNITTQGGVFATTFKQHPSNYGVPLEVGRYIDMHNPGSTADVDVRIETSGTTNRVRIANGNDLSQWSEFGRINNNATFIKNGKGGQFLTMTDDGRLTYDGSTVPHNWRQSFTPFLFCDTGNFTSSSAVGQATYLGDLIYVQGRVIARKNGGSTGGVWVGGLPVSAVYNYPSVSIGFFGGVTDAMNSLTYGINGYLQAGSAHITLNFTLRNAGWQQLKCVHISAGDIDISFSAVYRWR